MQMLYGAQHERYNCLQRSHDWFSNKAIRSILSAWLRSARAARAAGVDETRSDTAFRLTRFFAVIGSRARSPDAGGDVYPRDPHRPGKEKIVNRILTRTQPGSIIILHDGGNTEKVDRGQTVDAIKEVIPLLKQKGFEFVTLSAMFKLSDSLAVTANEIR